jgi:hypothetical protein
MSVFLYNNMKFILEFKSFYDVGDTIIIEYWYNDMLTPVKIVEKISKKSFRLHTTYLGLKLRVHQMR